MLYVVILLNALKSWLEKIFIRFQQVRQFWSLARDFCVQVWPCDTCDHNRGWHQNSRGVVVLKKQMRGMVDWVYCTERAVNREAGWWKGADGKGAGWACGDCADRAVKQSGVCLSSRWVWGEKLMCGEGDRECHIFLFLLIRAVHLQFTVIDKNCITVILVFILSDW